MLSQVKIVPTERFSKLDLHMSEFDTLSPERASSL